MHRKNSPIRHDYNQGATQGIISKTNARHAPWFVVGLGLPLAILALYHWIGSDEPEAVRDSLSAGEQIAATPGAAYEAFSPPALDLQVTLDTLPAKPTYTDLILRVKSGDSLDSIFRRNHLNIADMLSIAGLDAAKQPLRVLRPGDELTVSHADGRVKQLQRNLSLTEALLVEADEDGRFSAKIIERPVEYRQTFVHGVIKSSLFESAAAIGLSDKVIMNVAGIFAWDIDFVYDIRVDDEYYVIYEEIWQDGEKVADGEIVAAEFVNRGEAFQAIRYINPEGSTDYFNPDGRSVRKAFVRAPVDFKRISSSFNPNRRHPILNTIRAHRGVDYSASSGTPIMAAGDGKIIFRGVKNGYGKVVIVQHGGNITTLYAHMSNYRRGQRVGTRVKQGQVIGYVGRTGLATAPHLHYEYRLNGVHRNPRTVKLPQAQPIDKKYLDDFLRAAKPVLDELERYKTTRLADLASHNKGNL